MILNYSDIQRSLASTLYGGAESLNERRKIHDLISQATGSDVNFEPEWQADLINICSRLSQSTHAASEIPDLINDLLNNSFYDTKLKISPEQIDKYPDLTRKFTQDLMQFLTSKTALDISVFEDFMAI